MTTEAAPLKSTALPNVVVLPDVLRIPQLDRLRTLRLYLPSNYHQSEKRYPVIYMHDAQNLFDDATAYAGEWGVDETMAELERTLGFEAIVAGIDHGGVLRAQEMIPWAQPWLPAAEGREYIRFVLETVKPWLDTYYRTVPNREATAMVGSSFGGLITHYALVHYPHLIGMAAILSPSYFVSEQIYNETRDHPWADGGRT